MSVYSIILNESNKKTWDTIKSEWAERSYILTDTIAFIAPEKINLTQEIANILGMNSEGKVTGMVIESKNKAGWNDSSLIEWLGKVE